MIWFLPWETDDTHARHHPWATWALIVINVAVHLARPADAALEEAWYLKYGLIAGDWHWYQFVTSSFMHGGWMHLLGNMFFLWMFGDNVEDALGIGGFLFVYFLGGLAGDVMYVSANAHLFPSIGASGCIAAIAGAYAVMFFSRSVAIKVIILVFPVYTWEMRAFWLLMLWFGLDIWRTMSGGGELGPEGGVNFVAHGAGFLFGAAVGIAAVMYGTMRRYAELPNGTAMLGYVSARLETEHRAAVLRRQRQQAQLETHRQAARADANWR